MAYTTVSSVLGSTKSSNLLNDGDIRNIVVDGIISGDMAPGAWVYHDVATGTWLPLDTDTADAHKIVGPGGVGVILYRPRIYTSTGALRLNSDDYDITYYKKVPICTSGIVVCDIVDQNAAVGIGTGLIASTTAESVTIQALEATGATSGTAIRNTIIATLAANVADDDTKCIAALGTCMGSTWGGINE